MRIIVTALLAALAPASLATAQGVTHTYANTWISTDFPDAANPGCSIGSDGSVAGGRLIMGASMRRPAPVNLIIRRPAWMLPDAPMRVRAIFSDGTTMTLIGRGHGQAIELDLDAGALPAWVHMLTASPAMQLAFDGNEPPWQFDLSGTTKVVNAMGDCLRNHNIAGVPAPFALGAVVAQPAPPPPGIAAPVPGGDAAFAQAMAQMGRPRADVTPPVQYAPAATTPVTVPQAAACAGIAAAQDRLACYDAARAGRAVPVAVPPLAPPLPAYAPRPAPVIVEPPPR